MQSGAATLHSPPPPNEGGEGGQGHPGSPGRGRAASNTPGFKLTLHSPWSSMDLP